MAAYGDTFFFGDDDDPKGHLQVIITEPNDRGEVITVSITTRHKKSDAMVPLVVGDHPFIKAPSVVTFNFAKIRTIAEIDAVIAKRDAKKREPMDEKILKRCRSALQESEFTPYEVLELYGSLEQYKK
jgi:hypothetical protein